MAEKCIVVGGGIAGLATAWQLAKRGVQTCLFEQEPLVASHSSGRNAAIWMPMEDDSTPALALRQLDLMDEIMPREEWLRAHRAVVTARTGDPLGRVTRAFEAAKLAPTRLEGASLEAFAPSLAGGEARCGVATDKAGLMDIAAMTDALARAARQHGASLHTDAQVSRVSLYDEGVRVWLSDGTEHRADTLFIAAGAFCDALVAPSRSRVRLTPRRRHLHILQGHPTVTAGSPIVWHLGEHESYFRPELDHVLASGCDQDDFAPCLPASDPQILPDFATRLQHVAPTLETAGIRRSWACLRTFAADGELVVGQDGDEARLFWVAGLGGRGMTVGVAAAELSVRQYTGEPLTSGPLGAQTGPVLAARFCT